MPSIRDLRVLSCNVQGIKYGGHGLIHQLKRYGIVGLQESRFRDPHHASQFRYLTNATFGCRTFIADANSTVETQRLARSAGVIIIIRNDVPGAETAVAVHTISNRYMLVKLSWPERDVFVHNIYAPNNCRQRREFFEELPHDFDRDALHIVVGDFNVAVDADLDASAETPRTDPSRRVLCAWLAQLGVIDAWRLHHPTDSVFSGPLPRRNRLDYIFIDHELCSSAYLDSDYSLIPGGGDHLAHQFHLTGRHHPHGPGYWRLPSWPLEFSETRDDIRTSAKALFEVISRASNPGLVWQTWKKRLKGQLRERCRLLSRRRSEELRHAQQHLECAAERVVAEDYSPQSLVALYEARLRLDSTRQRYISACSDQGFDLAATQTETSSHFFFRPAQTAQKQPIQRKSRKSLIRIGVNSSGTTTQHPDSSPLF